jgi:2-polyprenyl-3-methyl-5-hydroxy-6-metoxy-1,4-benzoquinol methylase
MTQNYMKECQPEAEAVRNYFSGLSQQYSGCFLPKKTGTNFSFRQRLSLATAAAQKVSGHVMDCATGSGEILAGIVATGKFDRATVLDLSPKMLELASNQIKTVSDGKIAAKVELVCDDVFHFASENAGNKYELIVCLGLIAHTGRLPELLRLLRGLLVPKGIILLQSTLLDHPGTRLIKLLGGSHSVRKHGYPISYFCHQDIEAACGSAGLKIAECRRYTLGIPFGDRLWAWGNYQMERIFQGWAVVHGSEAIYILKSDAAA